MSRGPDCLPVRSWQTTSNTHVTTTVRIPIFDDHAPAMRVTEAPLTALEEVSDDAWPLGLLPKRERVYCLPAMTTRLRILELGGPEPPQRPVEGPGVDARLLHDSLTGIVER